MYYQHLIIINECSKKLLKMKNSKSFVQHLVLYILYLQLRTGYYFVIYSNLCMFCYCCFSSSNVSFVLICMADGTLDMYVLLYEERV